jgi:1-acyl-sn-glycerol-3-phosphate acyltransferase
MNWTPPPPPPTQPLGPCALARAALKGIAMGAVIFGGLAILLALRLIERPLAGQNRPVTPHITVAVCRATLAIMGLRVESAGRPLRGRGALVANHASWLDIFVLNSRRTVYFVSKSEVADWPGIGWLARATGTLFIRRDRREAQAQARAMTWRLSHGHHLLFFPEGTSTDGLRVLPFKTTLFAAFYDDGLPGDLPIQAISLRYHAPPGKPAEFYGWWGEMEFAPSLLAMLAQRPHGHVTLVHHPPVRVGDYPDRKRLAAALEAQVRGGFDGAG